MKITRITLVRLSLPLTPPFPAAWDPEPRRHFPATVVLVDTDEGVRGVGSGDSMDGFDGYTGLFIGTDPLALARQVRALETVAFHGCRPWPLEAALWDIAGQVTGQPVARLLGGFTDRLPAYASTGALAEPPARVEMALAAAEMGFQAMKIRIDPARLGDGLACLAAVREALPGLTLMADLNQGWRMPGDTRPPLDRAAARGIAVRLAELDVYWMEEPLSGTDAGGLAALRSDCPVRVAGGEMARSYAELTYTSPTRCSPWASRGQGRLPSTSSRRAGCSARTPGPTALACWRTCTLPPASVAARTSNTPSTLRAGRPPGGTSCWLSPSR